MNDPLVILTLRLVHIVSGVLWVGAAAMLVAFVLPAARDSSNGMKYLRRLIWDRGLDGVRRLRGATERATP